MFCGKPAAVGAECAESNIQEPLGPSTLLDIPTEAHKTVEDPLQGILPDWLLVGSCPLSTVRDLIEFFFSSPFY
jgi:hypothetical protein